METFNSNGSVSPTSRGVQQIIVIKKHYIVTTLHSVRFFDKDKVDACVNVF